MKTDADYDDGRDATSAYGRLTSTHVMVATSEDPLPERQVLVGSVNGARSYTCTVTIEEYRRSRGA